ncbi:sulfatase [Flavobacterium faecale]|uniref:Sulfatase n=1 Tax=Flavobacterium faecale TaxID=1355330 RepID=A0A2S1LG87_9FLAO|nr:sulfatase [Flavobacterium faecale]AWG22671.1 sulfatase [Flavobacterium faecale]
MKTLATLTISSIFLLTSIPCMAKKYSKPNIVLIMADDLGYGDISCYGSTKINTPNIDRLALQGVKFLDFHSNGTVCSPTRAALMTGKYQQRTGVEGVITAASHREVGLSLSEITLAEELKKQGYSTGIFGKWHLGYAENYSPFKQGFDSFWGYVGGNIDYQSHVDQEGYLDWWNNVSISDQEGYSTDLITKYGVEFIKNSNPKNTGKPFFLYLPHEAPHYPFQGRKDAAVRKEGSSTYTRKVNQDSIPFIYKEMIEIMDEGIGKVMQTIDDEGLRENTIIVFCSDNGGTKYGSNGVLRDFKASLYEGGHRVPAIISFPGKIKEGTTTNETVLSMDFLPTFLDFIGVKPSGKNIDGVSIKNLLLHGKKLANRDLFWSFGDKSVIRNGDWKLISSKSKGKITNEVYNLKNDLGEKKDLNSTKTQYVKEMLLKLEKWEKEVRIGVTIIAK